MTKIVFFELEPWEKNYLSHKLKGHSLNFVDAPVSAATASDVDGAEVVGCFIYSRIGLKELAKWPKVKLITTLSTGYDHIDLNACAKRGIKVCNVPSYGSHTVAEHALALMLSLSKKIIQSSERTRQGNFSLEGLRTYDLENKTLGLIGFGKIGSHLAKTAKALGMHVRVYDPHADANLVELLTCKSVTLDELLRVSDIISLHCNLTPENAHLINKDTLAKMKKGVIIINTARGGLIDNKALVQAIDSGQVGGAGLDVLEEEGSIKEERQLLSSEFKGDDLKAVLANHMLLNKPNVIVTPHNAFNSTEALERILDTTVENILAYKAGKPVNVVGVKK